MIVSWRHLLLTFPLLIAFLLVCYWLGFLFSFIVKREKEKTSLNTTFSFSSVFWNLFTGLCLVVSCYAIITTKFRTCLLPVPLLVYLFHRLNRSPLRPALNNVKEINFKKTDLVIFYLLAILLYWGFNFLCFISFDPSHINYISNDSNFYGRIASHLNFTGKENTSLDYLGLSSRGAEPYHYGELWLIAFIKKMTGLKAAVVASMIAYPLLIVTFLTGLAAYIQQLFPQKAGYKTYYLLLLSGFTNGFLFLFPGFIIKSDILSTSLVSYSKLLIVAVLIIGLLQSLKKLTWNHTLLIGCMGSLLYTTIAPVLFISLGCLLFVGLLKKPLSLKEIVPGVIAAALSGSYLYLFYYTADGKTAYLSSQANNYSLSTTMNIILSGVLQLIPLLPFFILLIFIWGNQKISLKKVSAFLTNDLSLLIVLPFAGLLSWSVLYTLSIESVQLFQNVFLPVCSIMIILVFFASMVTKSIRIRVIGLVFIIISIAINYKNVFGVHSISTSDATSLKYFLNKNPEGYFVNLKKGIELNSYFSRNTEYNHPLIFIDYFTNPYVNISLNTPYITIDSLSMYAKEEKKIIASSPFSEFVQNNANQLSPRGYDYEFIKKYRILYFSVSPDTILPATIRPLVKDSVTLEDNGWKIYYIGQ